MMLYGAKSLRGGRATGRTLLEPRAHALREIGVAHGECVEGLLEARASMLSAEVFKDNAVDAGDGTFRDAYHGGIEARTRELNIRGAYCCGVALLQVGNVVHVHKTLGGIGAAVIRKRIQ